MEVQHEYPWVCCDHRVCWVLVGLHPGHRLLLATREAEGELWAQSRGKPQGRDVLAVRKC